MTWSYKFIVFVFIALTSYSWAQKASDVILKVGNEEVTVAEFERIYKKNNQMVDEAAKKSIDEYLQLFINYKLKVAEAKEQRLDTKEAFIKELEGYKKQLSQPYLIDKETEKRLQDEAYQRLRYEISASHILIAVPEKASPSDTLAIYNKVLKIRDRIIKGEPFEEVARATSDDPSVKRNSGFLGYFTAFQMVYPFENAAYKTPVGKVSMPVRTQFGYHLIKVHDLRPSKGQIKAAHIMIAIPRDGDPEKDKEAKQKIDEIHKRLMNNEDFATLAREFSQDQGTARNGGELPIFGSGRMVPEFEQAAFSLERDGQISIPIRTQFGWHLIKRIERKEVGSFDEMIPEIKQKLSRDQRANASRKSFINTQKNRYNYRLDSAAVKSLVSMLDSSIYLGNWQPQDKMKNTFLFQYSGKNYTQFDLANQIARMPRPNKGLTFRQIVNKACSDLVENTIIQVEEERLYTDNEDFFYLMKEYYEGILLFEITNMNVWSKATNDADGLSEFYNRNLDKYAWESRYHGLRIVSKNEKQLKKAHKLATSKKGATLSTEEFLKKFIVKGDTLISIQPVHGDPSDNAIKDFAKWPQQVSTIQRINDEFFFHKFLKIVPNEPKPLNEVRGQVVADYQDYLESEWMKKLRSKHEVSINNEILKQLKGIN